MGGGLVQGDYGLLVGAVGRKKEGDLDYAGLCFWDCGAKDSEKGGGGGLMDWGGTDHDYSGLGLWGCGAEDIGEGVGVGQVSSKNIFM